MISVHRIDKNGEIPEEDSSEPRKDISSNIQLLDKLVFRRYLIRWIAGDHIAFRQVESPYFRDLIAYCCRDQEIIPQTGKTIRNWLLEDYRQVRIEL